MNASAATKLKMMKASVRCFAFGLLSLLPVIGFPFAVTALVTSGVIRKQEKQFWNAAKPYRMVGVACAALATTGWLIVALLIAIVAVSKSSR